MILECGGGLFGTKVKVTTHFLKVIFALLKFTVRFSSELNSTM